MQIKYWYIVSILIIVADLVTKACLDGVIAPFIPGVVSIFSTHNYGASWSILSGATWFFIVLGCVFVAAMIAFDIFYKKDFGANGWYRAGFVLLLSGILGNLIDRIAFGYVRDFIRLEFINFPIFNIADIALTCGCICIIVFILFFAMRDKKDEQSARISAQKLDNEPTQSSQSPTTKQDSQSQTQDDQMSTQDNQTPAQDNQAKKQDK